MGFVLYQIVLIFPMELLIHPGSLRKLGQVVFAAQISNSEEGVEAELGQRQTHVLF